MEWWLRLKLKRQILSLQQHIIVICHWFFCTIRVSCLLLPILTTPWSAQLHVWVENEREWWQDNNIECSYRIWFHRFLWWFNAPPEKILRALQYLKAWEEFLLNPTKIYSIAVNSVICKIDRVIKSKALHICIRIIRFTFLVTTLGFWRCMVQSKPHQTKL